jgi:hypothetical protein
MRQMPQRPTLVETGNMDEQKQGMHVSRFGLKGRVEINLYGPDGELKDKRVIKDFRVFPNTVTTFGDKLVANRMSGASLSAPSHMAIGTGTGGTSSFNSLKTELDRNALTSTTQGTGTDDNDVIYVGTWAAGDGTGAITEAGIFIASSGPGMMVYSSFSAINKGSLDTLTITWTVTFGAS